MGNEGASVGNLSWKRQRSVTLGCNFFHIKKSIDSFTEDRPRLADVCLAIIEFFGFIEKCIHSIIEKKAAPYFFFTGQKPLRSAYQSVWPYGLDDPLNTYPLRYMEDADR